MLVFGVDIPITEILLAVLIMVFFLLIEAVVIITLLVKQLNKLKR